jgi:ubiquinone/menaquinone biosynthesis C-methylase UbiE
VDIDIRASVFLETQGETVISSASLPEGLAAKKTFENALLGDRNICPFVRWHMRTKFQVMEKLFAHYLPANSRFLDMACGRGDGLLLASLCQEQCEIWGLDIYGPDLEIAKARVPSATLVQGDMLNPGLPSNHFDVVHEFGATFMVRQWTALVRVYMSLLREGGILLWELPQKWSSGHIAYLFSLAPKITDTDTKLKRIIRSFSPYKYRYESDAAILKALDKTGYQYEVLERVPIWYFYCRGILCRTLDFAWKFGGDDIFEWCDRFTGRVWPRYAGYYLVVRKKSR